MTAPSWPSPFSGPVAAASVARRASASARSLRLDSSHESRRRFTKALVGHAPAPRHVVVGEAPGRLAHLFRKTLVPIRARVRSGEQFFHDLPALAPELRERAPHAPARSSATMWGDSRRGQWGTKDKRASRERKRRAGAGRAVADQRYPRPKPRPQRRSHGRIRAVGAVHDVLVRELVERGHAAAIFDLHA